VLSVVVAIVSDTTERPANVEHLEPCLEVLCAQSAGLSVEIIVPYHSGVEGVAGLKRRYPGVRFVKVGLRFYTGRTDSHEHHHELRSRGIELARGEIVALTEDHGIPAPDWCRQIIEAHRQPFACIGGAIENAIDRPLNRAVCFCDFLRYQNPVPEGESSYATDANVAYKLAALMAIRPVWEERFYEPSVHEALRTRGEKIALAPRMILYQHRRNLRIGSALKERFVWGRSYGASRGRLAGTRWRFLWTALSSAVPLVILTRMTAMAIRKRRMAAFFVTLPLTVVLTGAWAIGEVAGYITGRSSAAAMPKDGGGSSSKGLDSVLPEELAGQNRSGHQGSVR
jgi:hypothetical protein